MELSRVLTKQVFIASGILLIALVGGYFAVKGTFGSRVGARYSASSVAEFWYVGTELHMVTRNTRFTMYEFIAPHKKGSSGSSCGKQCHKNT